MYPIDTDCYCPPGEDRKLCDERLRQESLNIFQKTGGGADILYSERVDGNFSSFCVALFYFSFSFVLLPFYHQMLDRSSPPDIIEDTLSLIIHQRFLASKDQCHATMEQVWPLNHSFHFYLKAK